MADDNDNDTAGRKVAITNNDGGPRSVYTARGQVIVRVGETLNTVMNVAQLRSLEDEFVTGTEDAPRWTVEGTDGDLDAGSDQGKALDSLPVAKLRQIAEAEEVALTGRVDPGTNEALPDLKKASDIAAAIQAKRMTNTPA
jgi:hypothetical protein